MTIRTAGPDASTRLAGLDPQDTLLAASRFERLRHTLTAQPLSFLMEAHSGLSAKIAEEAGFEAIWASGLTISASLGLRDSNEASWTQVLEVLEYMADATQVPILVDGDTGYGNFNSVRRLVRKLGERGIAGVCIEDKLFPKTNSFIGEGQPLADVAEFCGRIRAGKDSQTDDAFTIVARTEALISGRGMDEALRRAEAYHAAGADAILIHSKISTAAEILGFAERWAGRSPLVIVPTMYYATPTDVFREAGINAIIWANHLLRSSITAMQETARRIAADQSLTAVEGRVATVKDVFRLAANAELEAAERRYLPATQQMRAVVLAASQGDLGSSLPGRPKCLADVRGRSVLRRLLDSVAAAGVRQSIVVRGYAKEAVTPAGAELVDNDRFADTGEAWSLAAAEERLEGELLVSYGDILFRDYILRGLLGAEGDVVIAVDTRARGGAAGSGIRDLVEEATSAEDRVIADLAPTLSRIAPDLPADAVAGEWIGLARFSARGTAWLREEIALLREEGLLETADIPLLLTRLATKHAVALHFIAGDWMDVDTLADLADARNFT
jgi:phosphoenolpyruvate phosphomutase